MSEPTRWRIDGLVEMLLAIGRTLGTALVMCFLFGPLLVAVPVLLIVGLFDDPGMEIVIALAGLALVALLFYLEWRSGNL